MPLLPRTLLNHRHNLSSWNTQKHSISNTYWPLYDTTEIFSIYSIRVYFSLVEFCFFPFICNYEGFYRSQDNAVGTATGYGLDDRGARVRVSVGSRISPTPQHPDQLWGPHSLLCNGYQALFPWVKRSGREAYHSSPTSAEAKKMWIYTSTPPYAFMTQCLIS
jgi:hypothetical protein